MKVTQIYLLLHLTLTASVLVDTFSFTGFIGDLWQSGYESCNSNWIFFNAEGLKADLETKLFGQHIASSIILKAVNRFMNDPNPKKPLVLSLHGPTGTGKNFVTKLITNNIYKKGMDSSFVRVFISTHHFHHLRDIDLYKSQLQQAIKDSVTTCERSMFIFDEMDKMHPGLIDSIKPFLDYYDKLDGVSYQKTMFIFLRNMTDCHHKLDGISYRKASVIFLSNDGGEIITQTALKFWKEGLNREDIKLKELEREIAESVLHRNISGFWNSRLIEKGMIDFFVPFLPLEYRHVMQCLLAQMKAKGLQENRVTADRIARDLVYFPKFERVFSQNGCKAIENRLEPDE